MRRTKNGKDKYVIFLIIVVAVILRFYYLRDNLTLSGELGDNLLDIKNAIANRNIPLLGPPTSHPWLYFGPLYFWLMIPFTILFNFDPIVISFVGASFGVFGVILNYCVIKEIFDDNIALVSSYLIAISSFFVRFARTGRFMFIVSVLIYIFIYALFKIWKNDKRYIFWMGLIFGIMLSFHLTVIVLIPVIVLILFRKRKILDKKTITGGIIGLLIPSIPFLLHDLTNGFQMTIKFLAWIPYRAAGFVGIIPKNNLTVSSAEDTFVSVGNYFYSSIVPDNKVVALLITLIVVIFILFNIKKRSFGWIYLKWSIFFSFLAFLIHTNPPSHYFVPILSLPIILFSIFIIRISKIRYGKAIVILIIIMITLLNTSHLFSGEYFNRRKDVVSISPFNVPYNISEKVALYIVDDAENKPYSLNRVGPDDQFEGDYAQNYQYILWYLGNEPVKVGDTVINHETEPDLNYTIYEDESRLAENVKDEAVWISNVAIVKKVR